MFITDVIRQNKSAMDPTESLINDNSNQLLIKRHHQALICRHDNEDKSFTALNSKVD